MRLPLLTGVSLLMAKSRLSNHVAVTSALPPAADIAVIAPGTMFGFRNPWILTPRLLRSGCSMTPGAPYVRILPAAARRDAHTEDANHGVPEGRTTDKEHCCCA